MLRQTIASAVDLGTSLTGRLLAFARRQHLERRNGGPARLWWTGSPIWSALPARRGRAGDRLPTGSLPVLVDPGQLESAILNLCLNAGQAIEGAGRITLSVRREGDLALIEVADTGTA
jgi:signal transduction histidine kinase